MSDKHITLITRGDDCGSSHSANLGIMESAENGILKNVSLMVTSPFIEEAAEMFANMKDLCFGLHATLNAEWDRVKWGPVLSPKQVPSLVDGNGMFLPSPRLFREHPPMLAEVMAELQAQLDKARRLGFDVNYVDTHMIIEWGLDGFEEMVSLWAKREGILYWGHYFRSLPKGNNLADRVDSLVNQLKSASPGQYTLIAHPAVDSPGMRQLGNQHEAGEQIALTRSGDIQLFTDPRVLECCQTHHIVPIRYDQAEKIAESLPTPSEF